MKQGAQMKQVAADLTTPQSKNWPRWRKRILIYKLFGFLPFGNHLFDFVRGSVGLSRNFDVGSRQYSIEEMLHMLKNANITVENKTIVEIGTGWHPVLPIFLYAIGAAKVIMTDVVGHIKQSYVEHTLKYLIAHVDELSTLSGVPKNQLSEKFNSLVPNGKPWQDVWQRQNIEYLTPFDFTKTHWSADSLDGIFSNSCISFIPQFILEKIISESFRVLKPGGFFAHNLMPYDDHATYDNTITPLNFLKFSPEEWEKIGNSSLHYQNRLRPAQYLDLLNQNKFKLLFAEKRSHHLKPDMIDRENLAAIFQGLPDEELLCAHFMFVGQKPQ